jgi:hypothetical protein
MTDDFLHNLRTSHRQRFDRNRKPYDNPQYRKSDPNNPRDRKGGFVRRGMDAEGLGGLKKLLEGLLDSHKVLIQAIQDMAEVQQRQAAALECIAGAMVGSSPALVPADQAADPLPAAVEPPFAQAEPGAGASLPPPSEPAAQAPMEAAAVEEDDPVAISASPSLLVLIEDLQKSGFSYEKIARHLEHNQMPTPSGRGHWRGSLVSRIIKEQAVAAAAQ